MEDRGTHVPCDARTADGVIRGAFVGLLWGAFGPVESLGAPKSVPSNTSLLASSLRYSLVSALSFSAFFGVYSGLLCNAERAFGRDSIACPLIAGGSIGSAIGALLPPPRAPNVLVCGSVTAGVSAVSAYMLQRK